jgi:hypothetical protein
MINRAQGQDAALEIVEQRAPDTFVMKHVFFYCGFVVAGRLFALANRQRTG